jgi:hypothetical protein
MTLFPGVRLNFSAHGISTSIGPRGASLTVGPHGTTMNLGIPGTGMSFRQKLTPGGNGHGGQPEVPFQEPRVDPNPATAIQSAPVAEVTSQGLAALVDLIKKAEAERKESLAALPLKQGEVEKAKTRLRRAQNWFFGLFLKKKVPERQAALDKQTAELKDLEDRINGTFIDAHFALDEPTKATFEQLSQAFEQLAGCNNIWDVVSEKGEDPRIARSSVTRRLDRKDVKFSIADDSVLQTESKVLCFQNANGADLLLYPGFIMMHEGGELALIDLRDIKTRYSGIRFVETDPVPSDAKVIDYTWAKCNKDGSPDRRFANNYKIPVVAYGSLVLATPNGLNEEYQFSNEERAAAFVTLFADYQNKLRVLGAKASVETHAPTTALPESTAPAGAGESLQAAPAVPFKPKSIPFIQAAEAISPQHAIEVVKQFTEMFGADVAAFSGSRNMAEMEQFANDVASAPGFLQAFLNRTPGTKAFHPQLIQPMRTMIRGVLTQMRTSIQKADAAVLAADDAQRALKVVTDAEAALK